MQGLRKLSLTCAMPPHGQQLELPDSLLELKVWAHRIHPQALFALHMDAEEPFFWRPQLRAVPPLAALHLDDAFPWTYSALHALLVKLAPTLEHFSLLGSAVFDLDPLTPHVPPPLQLKTLHHGRLFTDDRGRLMELVHATAPSLRSLCWETDDEEDEQAVLPFLRRCTTLKHFLGIKLRDGADSPDRMIEYDAETVALAQARGICLVKTVDEWPEDRSMLPSSFLSDLNEAVQ
jgi:hypothetical protein